MSSSNMAKRTAVGTLALAVCIGGAALAFAGSANADATPSSSATSSASPATTAAAGATLVLATGALPFDAVTATPLAVKLHAPVLLQSAGLYLDPLVRDYVEDAAREGRPVTRVVIVGGPDVVTYGAASELRRLVPDTTRVYGADRYATSVAVADVLGGRAQPVR